MHLVTKKRAFCCPRLAISFSFTSALFEMDERWNTHVRPILCELIRILLPLALIDGLYAAYLINSEEYEKIKTYDSTEGSQYLLVSILPRKGPDSFEQFLNVLRKTEGQERVAQKIIGSSEKKRRHDESSDDCTKCKETIRKLERKFIKEINKERVENISFRNEVKTRLLK